MKISKKQIVINKKHRALGEIDNPKTLILLKAHAEICHLVYNEGIRMDGSCGEEKSVRVFGNDTVPSISFQASNIGCVQNYDYRFSLSQELHDTVVEKLEVGEGNCDAVGLLCDASNAGTRSTMLSKILEFIQHAPESLIDYVIVNPAEDPLSYDTIWRVITLAEMASNGANLQHAEMALRNTPDLSADDLIAVVDGVSKSPQAKKRRM